MTIDFRTPDKAKTEAMAAEVEAAFDHIVERARVEVEVVERWTFGNEVFDADCIGLIKRAADELGVGYIEMLSQAGHDAYNMAKIVPTALIFSPCEDGISHNEAENIEPAYTFPSVNVLLHSAVARANR